MTFAETQPVRHRTLMYRRSTETRPVDDGFDVNDPLGNYLHELQKIPIPTRKEEVALATSIEKGRIALKKLTAQDAELKLSEIAELRRQRDAGEAAREELIKKNLRLVVNVAKEYQGRGVLMLDLIQEGNIGLMHATEKYDVKRGFRFSTYATWWIRRDVTYAIADQGRTIRVPINVHDSLRQIYLVQNQLTQELHRPPVVEEIAARLPKLDAKQIKLYLSCSREPLSLDAPSHENSERLLDEELSASDDITLDEYAEQSLLREHIERALGDLSQRRALVLTRRFGLSNGQRYTLKEIGQKLGVTREDVRKIEERALRRLRVDVLLVHDYVEE